MTIGYTPYAETLVVLGAVFIISSAVGIYMMLATRQVARKPHERFNEQNIILEKMNDSLGEIIIIETKPFRDDIHSQKDWKLSGKNKIEIITFF